MNNLWMQSIKTTDRKKQNYSVGHSEQSDISTATSSRLVDLAS